MFTVCPQAGPQERSCWSKQSVRLISGQLLFPSLKTIPLFTFAAEEVTKIQIPQCDLDALQSRGGLGLEHQQPIPAWRPTMPLAGEMLRPGLA